MPITTSRKGKGRSKAGQALKKQSVDSSTTKTTTTASTTTSDKKKTANKPAKKTETKENRQITDYFPVTSRRLRAKIEAKLNENNIIINVIENHIDPIERLLIKDFGDKGRGVVAKTMFAKDSFICEYSGDLIDLAEAKVGFLFTWQNIY